MRAGRGALTAAPGLWFTRCRMVRLAAWLATSLVAWSVAVALAEPVRIGGDVPIRVGGLAARALATPVAAPLDLAVCDVPGICWEVASVLSVAVNLELNGQSKRCAKRCRLPVFSLLAVGGTTYEIDGGFTMGCLGATADVGAGSVRQKGRRRYLVPTDPAGVEQALAPCFDGTRPNYSAWVRSTGNAESVRGKMGARATSTTTTPVGEGRIRAAFKVKLRGVPFGSPVPPPVKEKLDICPEVLNVRCELVVGP